MERLREAVQSALIEPTLEIRPGSAVGRFRFDEEFVGFEGHFPGRPILPAVVQIMAALQTAASVWQDLSVDASSVDKAKFLLPVVPGDEIEIHCTRTEAGGTPGLTARVLLRGEPAASFTVAAGSGEGVK